MKFKPAAYILPERSTPVVGQELHATHRVLSGLLELPCGSLSSIP
jgi:hypothetical protein